MGCLRDYVGVTIGVSQIADDLLPRPKSAESAQKAGPQLRSRTATATWRLAFDEVDEGAQRRRQMTAAGIIEKRSRKALPPWFQHRLQGAAVEVGTQQVLKEMDDANTGTNPVNAEHMFMALDGLGKPAALYMYPYEGHGPLAKETTLDLWARWCGWLDKYVKNPPKPK